MLSELQAVGYLLQHRIMTSADVVQRGVVLQDLSRRNRNFSLEVREGAAYFLKQSDSRQSRKTIAREAACYRLLWMYAADFASKHMPALLWFDSSEDLLVLEFLDAVEPLGVVNVRDSAQMVRCAAELGRALACLHTCRVDWPPDLEVPLPWVLGVCRPSTMLLAELSSTAMLALKIVQQIPDLVECFARLSRSCALSTPLHGDIRWENCVVRTAGSDVGHLYLLDWELAGLGDPCLDVGTVFAEYLRSWVRSLPVMPSLSLAQSLGLATCPLPTIQQAISAFWKSYCQNSSALRDDTGLVRCIEWSAARLVQAAIESAQASAQLSGTDIYTLQLAANILKGPRQAARDLLQVALS
jgi:hypothetical protein